ncbi:MAG: MarR family EPS-associated transcriptional regulator [Yoonia sp.]
MTSWCSKLQEDTCFRNPRYLQKNPDTIQRNLIKVAGISVGVMLYGWSAHIDKGIAKFGNFAGAEDKLRYAYVLSPTGIARKGPLARAFLMRKMECYVALNEEIQSLQLNLDKRKAQARA